MIAALFVDPNGCYAGLEGVDLWDEARDARLYAGPWPVVAHPPCSRWCQLAGLVEYRYGHKRGDDGGCFESALESVRRWGGVLEHPAYTAAWPAYGLPAPDRRGGWQRTICGGWVCHVEQGRYGHRARKATWLYAHGIDRPPALRWGSTPSWPTSWGRGGGIVSQAARAAVSMVPQPRPRGRSAYRKEGSVGNPHRVPRRTVGNRGERRPAQEGSAMTAPPTTTSEVLRHARKLIERGWCQDHYAKSGSAPRCGRCGRGSWGSRSAIVSATRWTG